MPITGSQETKEISFHDLLSAVLRRRRIALTCFLGIVIATILFNQISPKVYEAETTIVFEETKEPIPTFDFSQAISTKSFIQNQIEEIKSRTLSEEVASTLPDEAIKTFKIPDKLPESYTKEEIIASNIRENISVAPTRNSDVIKIKVRSHNPLSATVIANAITRVLKERCLKVKREEVSSMRVFIEGQLGLFEDQLQSAGLTLKEFKERNRVTLLDEESKEILKRITEAEVLYNQACTDRKSTEHRLNYIQKRLAEQKSVLVPSITEVATPWARKLKQKLVDLEVRYTTLKIQDYPESHPQVVKLKDQIAQTKETLETEMLKIVKGERIIDPLSELQDLLQETISLEINLETYRAKENALHKTVNIYNKKLQSLPEKEYELSQLIRDKEVSDKIYAMLLEKHEEARITEAGKVSSIRVIDPAKLPKSPIKPKKKLNLAIGVIIGLMLGIGLVVFLEYLDTSIKTIEDVERDINLAVLGSIPIIREKSKLKDETITSQLATNLPLKSHAMEAYRSLRTNIQFTDPDKPLNTILFTSTGPGEGKTLTVSNLGIVLALSGVKTLLIDCDLRRPVLHKLFQEDKEPGVVNILAGQSEVKSVIHKTKIDNLHIITCGAIPPNPAEMLGSHRMKELLSELKKKFDIILLDSPPVIAVTDPVVLSSEVDGVVLVIKSGSTSSDAVLRAKSLLENVQARIVGAVLNNVWVEGLYGRYGYYHHYHHYYTPEGEKKSRRKS